MNISEIESTLQTLRIRHPDLDEVMLNTLLTAGGWEEQTIKTAVVLFKGIKQREQNVSASSTVPDLTKTNIEQNLPKKTEDIVVSASKEKIAEAIAKIEVEQTKVEPVVIPTQPVADIVYFDNQGQEEGELEAFVDDGKVLPKVDASDLKVAEPQQVASPVVENKLPTQVEQVEQVEEKTENVLDLGKEIPKAEEPQSLIVQPAAQSLQSKPVVPPENLPVKPFESTPHVWPLSKYDDVFHGDVMPPLATDERDLVNKVTSTNVPVNNDAPKVKIVKNKKSGFDGEDEGLIYLTGITLIIILLLLAYMYSNGRL